jgi:hypothetical protein
MDRIEAHLQEETYGAVHRFPDEMATTYGHLILMIVGADGEVSADEWRYLVGRAKAMGLTDANIETWRGFDYKHGDLAATVQKFYSMLGAKGYAFIYDAVKVARVDGYHDAEKRAVRRAAAAAGIPEHVVHQLENLVETEEQLRQLRIALMYPDSSPYHQRAPR